MQERKRHSLSRAEINRLDLEQLQMLKAKVEKDKELAYSLSGRIKSDFVTRKVLDSAAQLQLINERIKVLTKGNG